MGPDRKRHRDRFRELPATGCLLLPSAEVNSEVEGAPIVNRATPLERQQVNVHGPNTGTFWHRVRFDIVAGQAAPATRHVIDFGAGSGLLGVWLANEHPEIPYSFIELSPMLEGELERRFGVAARYPIDAPIAKNSVVAILDVIEHIDDDAAALRRLADRMEPGAQVVVTVPALPWAFSSWDAELGHYRRYTRAQLRKVLSSCGFDVTECSYFFPELTVMLPVRKLRRRRRTAVDFPTLNPTVDRLAYAISSTTCRMRRVWPFGSSLVAVASRSAVV
jgi:hypothetical protein